MSPQSPAAVTVEKLTKFWPLQHCWPMVLVVVVLSGVVVEVDPIRRYLDERGRARGPLLSHVLGYTGPINLDEFRDLADDGYLRDDIIGRAGIEASFEETLRGTYGAELWERDASGRAVKNLETVREPVPGTNLMLTLDARMQRVATEWLKWGMKAVGVEQDRHLQAVLGQHVLAGFLHQPLAQGHVAAADEDRRALQVPGATGEDGAVD